MIRLEFILPQNLEYCWRRRVSLTKFSLNHACTITTTCSTSWMEFFSVTQRTAASKRTSMYNAIIKGERAWSRISMSTQQISSEQKQEWTPLSAPAWELECNTLCKVTHLLLLWRLWQSACFTLECGRRCIRCLGQQWQWPATSSKATAHNS
jgi:hypothetical protein